MNCFWLTVIADYYFLLQHIFFTEANFFREDKLEAVTYCTSHVHNVCKLAVLCRYSFLHFVQMHQTWSIASLFQLWEASVIDDNCLSWTLSYSDFIYHHCLCFNGHLPGKCGLGGFFLVPKENLWRYVVQVFVSFLSPNQQCQNTEY